LTVVAVSLSSGTVKIAGQARGVLLVSKVNVAV
jgi:hypothetical protein